MGSLSAARTDVAPSPIATTAAAQAANAAIHLVFNSILFIGAKSTARPLRLPQAASSLPVSSGTNDETPVYVGMALEVPGDGFCRDVLDREIDQGFGVELETRVVGGEDQPSARTQELQRPANHADVIALDVEHPLHAFGVGEGRRVDEDEVETRPPDRLALQPFEAIGAE